MRKLRGARVPVVAHWLSEPPLPPSFSLRRLPVPPPPGPLLALPCVSRGDPLSRPNPWTPLRTHRRRPGLARGRGVGGPGAVLANRTRFPGKMGPHTAGREPGPAGEEEGPRRGGARAGGAAQPSRRHRRRTWRAGASAAKRANGPCESRGARIARGREATMRCRPEPLGPAAGPVRRGESLSARGAVSLNPSWGCPGHAPRRRPRGADTGHEGRDGRRARHGAGPVAAGAQLY